MVTIMDSRSRYLTTDYTREVTNGLFSKTPDEENSAYLLYNIVIPVFGAIIVVSNLAVMISSCLIIKKGKEPKSTYLLLGNIATANLITGVAVIFGQLFPRSLRNHQICAAQIGLVLSCVVVSVYIIGFIAADRFLYILHGPHYQRRIHLLKLQAMVIPVWVFGCIIGYLPLMGWSGDTRNGQICCFIVLVPKILVLTIVVISSIPLMFIVLLYFIILYRTLEHIPEFKETKNGKSPHQTSNLRKLGRFKGTLNGPTDTDQHPHGFLAKIFKKKLSTSVNTSRKWKSVKIVFFTTSSFIFTWLPYLIVSLYYISICNDSSTKRCRSLNLVLGSPLVMLGFVNSLVNPVIYAWWHTGFNRFIQRRISTFRLRSSSNDKKIVGRTDSTMNKKSQSFNTYS